VLENVEGVLRPYDQVGREGGEEVERENMKEKGKGVHFVLEEGGRREEWKKIQRENPPSLLTE
jgi:hypothetical protein